MGLAARGEETLVDADRLTAHDTESARGWTRLLAYELAPTRIACPVCCGTAGLRLYSVTPQAAAQHFVRQEADAERFARLRAHIEKLWKGAQCDVVRCSACGFGCAQPYVAGDAEFYALAFDRRSYPKWKWEYQRTYDAIRDLGLRDFTLLEIGAGNGQFIRTMSPALTPRENVLCTEYSDRGRAAVAALGFRCEPLDIRAPELRGLDAHFDVLCMFQVLEHLDRLDSLFARLTRISRPGAHCFVAVPNPGAIEFNELHDALLDMPPNHIGRWERRCLEIMGQRHGWSVRECAIEPESFVSKAARFIQYRYLRRSQNAHRAANRAQRIGDRHLRRIAAGLIALGYAAASLPEIAALGAPGLGGSQWVHLIRTA